MNVGIIRLQYMSHWHLKKWSKVCKQLLPWALLWRNNHVLFSPAVWTGIQRVSIRRDCRAWKVPHLDVPGVPAASLEPRPAHVESKLSVGGYCRCRN